jgi:putative oxidoreductase
MKKLMSISYADWTINVALLVLRLGLGALIMAHGYGKLVRFPQMKATFLNFLHLGRTVSLSLDIFAEFFCAIFLIIGLFSRLATIPLIIAMSVALFIVHNGDIFGDGEKAALFLVGFLVLLLVGPGKASVDAMVGK